MQHAVSTRGCGSYGTTAQSLGKYAFIFYFKSQTYSFAVGFERAIENSEWLVTPIENAEADENGEIQCYTMKMCIVVFHIQHFVYDKFVMSVPQAAKNCWKAHCKAALRKAKAAKTNPYRRGVSTIRLLLFWFDLSCNWQDITEALDLTTDEEPDEETRILRKAKEARKEDHRVYEQEKRRQQQEKEEEMRAEEERKRLAREVRNRKLKLRVEAQKKKQRKRAALEAPGGESRGSKKICNQKQRAGRDYQVL